MIAQPRVIINHAHLRHNLAVLMAHATPAEILLAVKTNAYGHGLIEVSQTAIESGMVGLATLEIGAAVTLREAGLTKPLFAWLFADDEISHAVRHRIDLGVSRLAQLEAINDVDEATSSLVSSGPARVHLKFDSGLTRNGATEEQWPLLCDRALELQRRGTLNVVGIWTHLADASLDEDKASLDRFDEAVRVARNLGLTPQFLHAGASSFGLQPARTRYDYIRFGIAAYGISPLDHRDAQAIGLVPVMTMTAPVIHVDDNAISLAAGFGHGVLTGEHSERVVRLNERDHKVLSISVDRMRIEPSPHVRVGDTAVIFGEGGPTAEQLGMWCNTIGDEVVTTVSPRLPREHLHFTAST